MRKFTVEAVRSGRWWALQCLEVPAALSQVARLSQAGRIAEAIAFVAGIDESEVQIDLVVRVPDEARGHMEEAERARQAEHDAGAVAAAQSRRAAESLRAQGLTVREIGQVMGISFQRAHQLLAPVARAS